MKQTGLGLVLAMLLSSAAAQQVWKCEVNGQVRFSDKPCPGSGQPVAERSLQPNMAEGLKPEVARAAIAPPAAVAASAPAGPPGNVCPGDSEIRGMETRANSTTLGDRERQFLQDEVRRAWQCRKGQGRYTDADWAISRDAQARQTHTGDRDRRDARLRAEAMHSAADPDEGDRIARRRIAEDRLRERQAGRSLLRGQNPASTPTP
ncbi:MULTISPECIES: DUF4124 domain-containing protein [unclassified Roseateles]|uniref:DUF4124 domain-containing protein n=1 Tax=unclassified Roseateles TaxID=2626991 RepID=UPI0006FF64AE|nr:MULTISPECIES: DUF4124 domain-containing protein [unclassified Roseateles]KQW41129.1 hypothetical protein ASC81_22895 [Pelomonas sp. Root405]KRA67901.1 hypothetical protein ASD88_20880 [Pelomonas sp. Root662]